MRLVRLRPYGSMFSVRRLQLQNWEVPGILVPMIPMCGLTN